LFIYLSRNASAHTHVGAYGRNIGRWMVVARSNCSRMEVESKSKSNRSRIVIK